MAKKKSKHEEKRKPVPEMTEGEELFDKGNYYGVGWGLNTGLSVIATDFAFSRPGNPLYVATHKMIDGAAWLSDKLIASKTLDPLAEQFKTAAQGVVDGENGQHINSLINDGQLNFAIYKLKESFGGGKEGLYKLAEQLGGQFTPENIEAVTNHLVKKEINHQLFKSLAVISTLCIGGFALMVPIKLLEDNRRGMSEWLDNNVVDPFKRMTGNAPSTELERQQLQEKRQERYDYLEHEAPKQSLGSIFMGRIAALLPIYALHLAWWKPNNVVKAAGGLVTGVEPNPDPNVGFGGMERVLEGSAKRAGEMFYDVSPQGYKDVVDRVKAPDMDGKEWSSTMVGWVGADTLYTLVAAIATDHISKAFSSRFNKPKHEHEEVSSSHHTSEAVPLLEYQQPVKQQEKGDMPKSSVTAANHEGAVEHPPLQVAHYLP